MASCYTLILRLLDSIEELSKADPQVMWMKWHRKIITALLLQQDF